MSTPNCLQCGQPLPESDDLSRRCRACGTWNIVRGAGTSPAPSPAAPRPALLQSLKRRLGRLLAGAALLGVVVAGGLLYRALRSDVELYVDNGGTAPLEVRIDGRARGRVAPGTHAMIECRSGERLIEVLEGGRVVHSARHTLLGPQRSGRRNKYLLNPGAALRYHTYEVEYGFAMPKFNWNMRFGFGPEAERRRKYRELADKVTLFPVSEWADVSSFDHVLGPAPKKVQGNLRDTRHVLARVPAEDYERIARARQNDKPTQQEVDELELAVETILKAKE
jgi:hypothetical protein